MHRSKKVLAILAVLIFSSVSLFAQTISSATGTANVSISVKAALAITNVSGNLDFDDVLLGSGSSSVILPENGVKFRVDGHNSGAVAVTFSAPPLVNAASDPLNFTPVVHSSGIDPDYNSTNPVNNGDSEIMGTTGELYLWVGGSIAIAADTPQGDYAGTFSMTVAY